ncbi:MAG TPA: VWA domain-containing protein [Gemmataceae bacterium]|nr:VWA domain-containing protein [Gemmataceae bacterium]
MATETAPSPRLMPYGPGAFTRIVLPLLLLAVLALGVAGAVLYTVFWYLPGIGAGKDLIARRLEEPFKLAGQEFHPYLWLAVLVPVLLLGLIYVVWMYVRDGVTIGWAWATFLAALRATVYAVLAIVFLLPALQTWEETRIESKVVLVFDVSGSMLFTRDEVPTDQVPLEKLLTRQDKVLRFLTDDRIAFLRRLQERNPVTAYRIGRMLDEDFMVFDRSGRAWTQKEWEEYVRNPERPGEPPIEGKRWGPDDWARWLKPDLNAAVPENLSDEQRKQFVRALEFNQRLTGATNLGDPLRRIFDRESNNLVQGIVIFTDGRNTEGSTEALNDLVERARKADPHIPIFVVGVGEDRERVKIEITDLRVPEQIRPEDKFRAAVDVTGEGLADKEVKVLLDISRADRKTGREEGDIILVELKANGEPTGREISLGPKVTLEPEAPSKFRPGNPPLAQAEFQIDALTLAKAAGKEVPPGVKLEFKDDPEAELRFRARVARDPREDFVGKEHVSDAAAVQVLKRPLRVLLFASGPMRDYQFVRTLLVREMDKNRAELSVYLQPPPGQVEPRPGRVQDVPPERLLRHFPDKLQDESLDKPDEMYYNLARYDVIIAFDPDWTQLNEQQIQLIERWVGTHGGGLIAVGGPVNTLQLARPGASRDKFKPILDLYPVFLEDSRIQEVTRETDKPWRLNFPGASAEMEFLQLEEDTPDTDPLQPWEDFFTGRSKGSAEKAGTPKGFFNYYPVKQKKDGATVVATFSDPRARLADGQEQPYLVVMPYGSGKTVWLGSAEMWRLRQVKEAYYERFWTKLARFAGSGNLTRFNRRVVLNMGRVFTANNYVNLEAQVFGHDMKPLPEKARPRVQLKLPAGVTDKEAAKAFELTPKPTQGEWNGWFAGRFLVKAPGEYTLELTVPETNDSVTRKFLVKEANLELDNTRPDPATLHELASEADRVLARIPEDVRRELKERLQRRKPAPADAKDQPAAKKEAAPEERLRLLFDLSNADIIPSCMKTDSKTHRNRGATTDLWDSGFAIWPAEPPEEPIRMSTVLAVVVGLLSVEWLTRKLLRLA